MSDAALGTSTGTPSGFWIHTVFPFGGGTPGAFGGGVPGALGGIAGSSIMMPKSAPGLTSRSVAGVSAGVVGNGGTVSVVVSGEV